MRLSHVENRIMQQLSLIDIITNAYSHLVQFESTNMSTAFIQTRISSLKNTWSEFSNCHEIILIAVSSLDADDQAQVQSYPYFCNNLFMEAHERYMQASGKLNSLIEQETLKQTSSLASPTVSQPLTSCTPYFNRARLPKIELPKFDGSPADWLSFKDMFNSLVSSSPSLTSVEKLQYLKTSLTGSAALLIKNTALTADNFQKSWDALIAFYENKRLLVNATMHSLLHLKRMTKESASELEQLYSNIMQLYRTLETLQRPVATWDDVFVFVAVQRLDSETTKAWEHHVGSSKDPPTWQQLSEFLLTRMLSLQAFERSKIGKPGKENNPRHLKAHYQGKQSQKTAKQGSSDLLSCTFCKLKHFTNRCPSYLAKTVPQRRELIIKHRLCFNCLKPHRSSVCTSTNRCLKCAKKHHTSIHEKNTQANASHTHINQAEEALTSTNTSSVQPKTQILHVSSEQDVRTPSVLLATADVLLSSPSGETSRARVLIDQGAEISLISERMVQRLRLNRTREIFPLVGIGGKTSNTTNGSTSLELKSLHGSSFKCDVTAHILPKLTASLPSMHTKPQPWPHLDGLSLADPDFLTPRSIDLILGAEVYSTILEHGLVKGPAGSPMAQCTKLGWIISGPTNSFSSSAGFKGYHVSCDAQLYTLIQRFWELDEIPSAVSPLLSMEDQACEDHFVHTHSRNHLGRYVVRLPFKQPQEHTGNSKAKATRLVHKLVNTLSADASYASAYFDFIHEYEQLGHMIRVPADQIEPEDAYYLPHHGVWKRNDPSTKLRVVFNGSSRTTSGKSLNDMLLVGPKLQVDLIDVLLWFRRFCYVFSTDVEKMYRQILIHPEDQKFQRILWIDQLQQALRTFVQLVEDEGANYPLARQALIKGRYVDDIFGGADTKEEAHLSATQLKQLCTAGGFELKKWVANHPTILNGIPPEHQLSSETIQIDDAPYVHTLGLSWQPMSDTFNFTFELPSNTVTTKRSLMSILAKLFDPLGFVSPVLITGKLIIQELWILKVDWDEPLPSHVTRRWNEFLHSLLELPQLTFSRWLGYHSDALIELHGFCDASQRALAAVIYVRVVDATGGGTLHLVCSKTKVAPLKKVTIPRLELSAGVLLTKLMKHVINILEFQSAPVFLWTDSSITQTWINCHPSKWKEFVQNRVGFIQETLPQAQWRFVPGTDNPADLATRGLSPSVLSGMSTWWSGPSWLSKNVSNWPREPGRSFSSEQLEERPIMVCTVAVRSAEPWNLINRYSTLKRLVRVTAWCRRIISRFRKLPDTSSNHPLTPNELNDARLFWIKHTQAISFASEIKMLMNKQLIPRANSLVLLTPFLDSAGFLRVGGRLRKSLLPEYTKHLLILPKMSPLTTLIIREAHLRTMHGGTQLTLSYLRNEYWIVGGRSPVRSFILKCVICARFRQQRAQQLMGQLPQERITSSRPFSHTGLDYAGPFSLKTWRGRNARQYKGYIALFVCFSTSAVHLELVTDYSTEAFLAAYKRFTSRRGKCITLQSDCGSNFKGADAELKKLFSAATSESSLLATLLADDGTLWKFIPPATPHFGGKWEAGVKSVKFHLKRVIGTTLLTYEEMTTVLTQIEAVLNSRPLCPLTNDPDDLGVLTPGHFLMGCPPTLIPEPSMEPIKSSRLSRWQLTRQMIDSFWSRWTRECLQRYYAMSKWNRSSPSLSVGSLALIIDERYPPGKWPLARVIATHPGSDGHVRIVTVQTQHSSLKRPITKLCPLPVEQESL